MAWRGSPTLLVVFLIAVSCGLSPRRGLAQSDGRLVWRTLETRHFQVHFHDPLESVARRVASVAERAYENVAPVLRYEMHEQTQIVLADDSDYANGFATSLPYNSIRLFVAAPEDLSVLGDYDDWPTELVTHEFTHIAHLDQVSGIPAIINAIVGKQLSPNNILPRWFIEGLAVVEESHHTTGGRVRSTMFDMYLRMDALENRLLSLDQATNTVERWPHGNSWYAYGSRFMDFFARRHGMEAIAEISVETGGTLIPYQLNRTTKRITGETMIDAYAAFLSHTRQRALAHEEAVRREGLREGERLTFHGDEARTPRFVDSAHLIYHASDGHSRSQLRMIELESRSVSELVRVNGNSAAAVTDRFVYYSQSAPHYERYSFNDLFRFDRPAGDTEQLTFGRRAQEPDVSRDGLLIAYTIQQGGTSHLAVSETRDVEGTRRLVARSPQFGQFYTPKWSPDGRKLAVSLWRQGGFRDVALVDAETGAIERITHDRALDTGPEWSPDGRLLYFASDRTGISNIYVFDLATGEIKQVTNVLGGAFQPAMAPDGRSLAYIGYTSRGFDVWRIALDPRTFTPARAYSGDRPDYRDTPPPNRAPVHDYSAWPSLLPRAYSIEWQGTSSGEQNDVIVSVAGADAVGLHRYEGSITVDPDRGDTSVDLRWGYHRYRWPIVLHGYRTVGPRAGLFVAGEQRVWYQRAVGGDIGTSYAFRNLFDSHSISGLYSFGVTEKDAPFGGTLDPNDPPPRIPDTGRYASARFGYSHSSIERNRYDISASAGHYLSASVGIAHPWIGSRHEAVSFSWAGVQLFENPWWHHHVLALRYGGGVSFGDNDRRATFAVGGFPDARLFEQLQNETVLGGVALRGYEPYIRAGNQFHLFQAEYRFPIAILDRGWETLPLYFNRLNGLVFVDCGNAFEGSFEPRELLTGIGGELFLEFTLGYTLGYSLRSGIARGLNDGGTTQFYFHLGVPF